MNDMTDDLVTTNATGDGIVLLTMHRPDRKNALSIALRDRISDVLDELAAHDDVKVVVITGEGDVFSAGFDLREFEDQSPEHQERLWASSDRFHHTVYGFPLPMVAAVNGPALAGGFDLACMADLRVASTTARFGHPEHRWSQELYRPLHDLVAGSIARDLVLTGRDVDADEALRIGLVAAVVPPAEVISAALDRARAIAEAPRSALLDTKRKILAAAGVAAGTATLDW